MRVAVIGAGPAGLACALTLERLGIRPDVFEKAEDVGHPASLVQVLLPISHPWLGDPISFFQRDCHLYIEPLAALGKVVCHCPGVRREMAGRDGYLVLRGRDRGSLERQLAGRLRTAVRFCEPAAAGRLAGSYDWVVVADGRGETARQAGAWKTLTRAAVRGARVVGDFAPGVLHLYCDTGYAGHGFGLLAPYGRRHALAVLQLVPAGPPDRMEACWRLFLDREGLSLDPIDMFELAYETGTVTRRQTGNVLLAGAAAGLTDPLLGLGLTAALASGVLAARAAAGQGDYEKMLQPYVRRQQQWARARGLFDRLDQAAISTVVRAAGLPLVRRLVDPGLATLARPFLPAAPEAGCPAAEPDHYLAALYTVYNDVARSRAVVNRAAGESPGARELFDALGDADEALLDRLEREITAAEGEPVSILVQGQD